MPKNTWAGIVISFFCLIFGFAFVWHIWWLVIGGLLGVFAAWIAYSFQLSKDYYVEVAEVESIENHHLQQVYQARPEYYQQFVKSREDAMPSDMQGVKNHD
jgi:cytochrome o ubiquinol oxidase subunit 1